MTLLVDTLAADTATLHVLQANPAYDYGRDFAHVDVNIFTLLQSWVNNVFSDIMSISGMNWLLVVLASLLLIGAVVFIFRRHRNILIKNSRQQLAYTVSQDNIYGVDFASEIADAESRGDYHEVVRLLYLQTLKQLDDAGRIVWQLSKTPSEYARELPVPEFRKLTNIFLRVRYGDYPADSTLADEVRQLATAVCGGNTEGGQS